MRVLKEPDSGFFHNNHPTDHWGSKEAKWAFIILYPFGIFEKAKWGVANTFWNTTRDLTSNRMVVPKKHWSLHRAWLVVSCEMHSNSTKTMVFPNGSASPGCCPSADAKQPAFLQVGNDSNAHDWIGPTSLWCTLHVISSIFPGTPTSQFL